MCTDGHLFHFIVADSIDQEIVGVCYAFAGAGQASGSAQVGEIANAIGKINHSIPQLVCGRLVKFGNVIEDFPQVVSGLGAPNDLQRFAATRFAFLAASSASISATT